MKIYRHEIMEIKRKQLSFKFPHQDTDVENGLEDTGRGKGKLDEVREWHGHIYTTKCKIDS